MNGVPDPKTWDASRRPSWTMQSIIERRRQGCSKHSCRLTTMKPIKEVHIMAIYRIRRCGICGNEFRPLTSRMVFCSPLCRFMDIASAFKDVDGCWEWPLSKSLQTGYGQFTFTTKPKTQVCYAHRLSYEVFVGPIPDEKLIIHSCDNRPCFNPKHLRPGTRADNAQDMVSRRRHFSHIHPQLFSEKMKAMWVKRKGGA